MIPFEELIFGTSHWHSKILDRKKRSSMAQMRMKFVLNYVEKSIFEIYQRINRNNFTQANNMHKLYFIGFIILICIENDI